MTDRPMNEPLNQKKPCATCFAWRMALALTAVALLVSWLAARY